MIEFFHDAADELHYDLSRLPPGCFDDWIAALRYANPRALGLLLDRSPQHMKAFGSQGPTRGQLAEVIRDQAFQIGLIFTTVARANTFASSQTPQGVVDLLKHLGDSLAEAYGAKGLAWESGLQVSLDTVAREVLEAMDHPQGSLRGDFGHDNSPLSILSLVAFSETLGRAIAAKANLQNLPPDAPEPAPLTHSLAHTQAYPYNKSTHLDFRDTLKTYGRASLLGTVAFLAAFGLALGLPHMSPTHSTIITLMKFTTAVGGIVLGILSAVFLHSGRIAEMDLSILSDASLELEAETANAKTTWSWKNADGRLVVFDPDDYSEQRLIELRSMVTALVDEGYAGALIRVLFEEARHRGGNQNEFTAKLGAIWDAFRLRTRSANDILQMIRDPEFRPESASVPATLLRLIREKMEILMARRWVRTLTYVGGVFLLLEISSHLSGILRMASGPAGPLLRGVGLIVGAMILRQFLQWVGIRQAMDSIGFRPKQQAQGSAPVTDVWKDFARNLNRLRRGQLDRTKVDPVVYDLAARVLSVESTIGPAVEMNDASRLDSPLRSLRDWLSEYQESGNPRPPVTLSLLKNHRTLVNALREQPAFRERHGAMMEEIFEIKLNDVLKTRRWWLGLPFMILLTMAGVMQAGNALHLESLHGNSRFVLNAA